MVSILPYQQTSGSKCGQYLSEFQKITREVSQIAVFFSYF